jgi:hypothetical protein
VPDPRQNKSVDSCSLVMDAGSSYSNVACGVDWPSQAFGVKLPTPIGPETLSPVTITSVGRSMGCLENLQKCYRGKHALQTWYLNYAALLARLHLALNKTFPGVLRIGRLHFVSFAERSRAAASVTYICS